MPDSIEKISKKPKKPKLEGAKYYAVVGDTLSKQVAQLKDTADEETFRNYVLKLQVEMLQWWCQPQQLKALESRLAVLPRLLNRGLSDGIVSQLLLESSPVPRSPPVNNPLPRKYGASLSMVPHPSQWDDDWVERMATMTIGDVHDLMMLGSRRVSVMVVPARMGGTDSKAYHALVAQTRKTAELFMHFNLHSPVWAARMYYNMETGEKVTPPSRQWWLDLLDKVQVSQASRERCAAAELLYRRQAAVLLQQQRELQAAIGASLETSLTGGASTCSITDVSEDSRGSTSSGALAAAEAGGSCGTLALAGGGTMVGSLEATLALSRRTDQVAAALQENLRQQEQLLQQHLYFMQTKGMTPLEFLGLWMGTYPYAFPIAQEVYKCLL